MKMKNQKYLEAIERNFRTAERDFVKRKKYAQTTIVEAKTKLGIRADDMAHDQRVAKLIHLATKEARSVDMRV